MKTINFKQQNARSAYTAVRMDSRDTERAEVKDVHGSKPTHAVLWYFMLFIGVLIYGSYTIFVHLCEVDGKLPFSSASMVLVQETIKLLLSVVMFVPEYREKGLVLPPVCSVLSFALPAVLYCINNNLAVHMQLEMDPSTYQVLGNLKILSTAFLYRLIIRRPITRIQWVALTILVFAGACNSYGGLLAKSNEHSAGVIHITLYGLAMILLYTFISGLAGVYSEYILKDRYEMSIHVQNGMLYMFGVLLNGALWFISVLYSDSPGDLNLVKGYSVYTWVLVFSQAFCGLIMSAIMKHGSNIVRLFLVSCAMLVTTVLSVAIFGLQLNLYFSVSFLLVLVALVLYNR